MIETSLIVGIGLPPEKAIEPIEAQDNAGIMPLYMRFASVLNLKDRFPAAACP
jgi:hypothetical protein